MVSKNVVLATVAVVVIVVAIGGYAVSRQPQYDPARLPGKTILERKKLATDISKSQRDDSTASRIVAFLTPLAPVLVAAGTLLFTISKALDDRRDQRDNEEQTRKQAEEARFDDRFAEAVKNLGSTNQAETRGAAVLLSSIVREQRADLSRQAVLLLVATLQVKHDEVCARLLRAALRDLIRSDTSPFGAAVREDPEVSLAYVQVPELKLAGRLGGASGPDLSGCDLGFAQLESSDFSRCRLERAKGFRVSLPKAKLRSALLGDVRWHQAKAPRADFRSVKAARADFSSADLTRADFYQAQLQGADFRNATLVGTKFHSTNVRDATFEGAQIDAKSLDSFRTANWRDAMFDPDTRARLASTHP